MKNKNSNQNRGQKEEGRKRVLVLEPREHKPNLLARKWKWSDEL